MDYTAKTDWGLEDTVLPVHVNKWEQGILDAKNELDLTFRTDGSREATGILEYSSDNDFTDDRQIPDLRTLRNGQLLPNTINSGAINTSGSANLISSSISTVSIPYSTPKMLSASQDGYTVSGYYQYFNPDRYTGEIYQGQSGTLYFPTGRNIFINKIFIPSVYNLGVNNYYIARAFTVNMYYKGTLVYSNNFPIGGSDAYFDIPAVQVDQIHNSYGWGSPWSGDGGGNGQTGKQYFGYELIQATTSDNTPVVGKDLWVNFNDFTPNDFYGLHTATVIGSPTYTNAKFNSNGTTALKYPITTMGTGSWCIQGKFKFNTQNTKYYFVSADNVYSYAMERNSANRISLLLSSNGSNWDIASAVLGTKSDWDTTTEYFIRLRFSGIQYLVDWSLDGQTWTNDITVNSTVSVYSNIGNVQFGIAYDDTYPLAGTMDELYVTVGSPTIIPRISTSGGGANYGKDLYVDFSDGTPNDRYGLHTPALVAPANISFDNNKYNASVVGSYITYPFTTFGTGSWCMQAKVSFLNTNAIQYFMGSSNTYGILLYRNASNIMTLCLSSNNTSWNLSSNSIGTKNDWVANTEYYVRLRFDVSLGAYYVDWSTDGSTWINDITVTSSTAIYTTLTTVSFGTGQALATSNLTGTMDELSITVGQPTIVMRSIYKKIKFNMSSPVSFCNCKREKNVLTEIADVDLSGTPQGATNQLFLSEDGIVDVLPKTLPGKDILFRFDDNAYPTYDSYNNTVTTNGRFGVYNGKGLFDTNANVRVDGFRFDGNQNWTLEFRMNPTVNGILQNIISMLSGVGLGILVRKTTANVMQIYLSSNNGWDIASAVVGTKAVNAYTGEYHIALVNDGSSYKLYVDGKLDITVTSSARIFGGGTPPYMTTNFVVGTDADNVTNGYYGSLDDVRLTTGIARWNTNFLPPQAGSLLNDRFAYVDRKIDFSQDILWNNCVVVNKSSYPNLQYKRQDISNSLFVCKSGNKNGANYPDLFSLSSKIVTTKIGGSYPDLVATKQDGTNFTISTASTLDCTSYTDGTYVLCIDDSGVLTTIPIANIQKDLYVDFIDSTPNDRYGLHIPTVLGTPSYANNKFNSNGATNIHYPLRYLGLRKWCVQGKFMSTNTTTLQHLFANYLSANYTMSLDKNTSNRLSLALGNTGNTTWGIAASVLGTKTDWATNTEYYIRLRFTGTQYLADWSLDGQTWTNDITVNSTAIVGYNTAGIVFGGSNVPDYPLIGTMDELQVTVGNDSCIKMAHYFKTTYEPIYKNTNTLWLDLTKNAVSAKKYDGSAWEIFNSVPIGEFTITNGLISDTKTYYYYQTGYPVSNSSWVLYKNVPTGKVTTNYVGTINKIQQPTYNLDDKMKMTPNYTESQIRVWATTYTATEDGWLYPCPYGNAGVSQYFVNGTQVAYDYCNYVHQGTVWVKILEGDKYYGTGVAGSAYFVPERGVNAC
jgi:hypothetical protein